MAHDRTAEALAYAAADAAIARADAITFGATFGRPQTDGEFVTQWTADKEAAEACRRAANYGPAHLRAPYRVAAAQFEAYSA